MHQPVHYSIRQVAQRTGLSTQVIRKWEDRYQIVCPKRLDNGYRAYSESDINRLLQVKHLTEQGFSVSNAVLAIVDGTHKELTDNPVPLEIVQSVAALETQHRFDEGTLQEWLTLLFEAGENSHEDRLFFLMQKFLDRFGLIPFIRQLIPNFLESVGNLWARGMWTEAQEHVVSLAVRDFLVQIRRSRSEETNGPLMLGACFPHERHEIPIHLILIEAGLVGWRTIFLGSSPAKQAMGDAITRLQPNRVVLSASTTIPFETEDCLLDEVETLATTFPQVNFCVGGQGCEEMAKAHMFHRVKLCHKVSEAIVL